MPEWPNTGARTSWVSTCLGAACGSSLNLSRKIHHLPVHFPITYHHHHWWRRWHLQTSRTEIQSFWQCLAVWLSSTEQTLRYGKKSPFPVTELSYYNNCLMYTHLSKIIYFLLFRISNKGVLCQSVRNTLWGSENKSRLTKMSLSVQDQEYKNTWFLKGN